MGQACGKGRMLTSRLRRHRVPDAPTSKYRTKPNSVGYQPLGPLYLARETDNRPRHPKTQPVRCISRKPTSGSVRDAPLDPGLLVSSVCTAGGSRAVWGWVWGTPPVVRAPGILTSSARLYALRRHCIPPATCLPVG